MSEETWKTITRFENYKVSNHGRIMNKHGRILKTFKNNNPHDGNRVKLYNEHGRYHLLIKRLVAQEFLSSKESDDILIIDVSKPISTKNLLISKNNRK